MARTGSHNKVRVARGAARDALLGAALDVIRKRGFSATSIDDLCAAAGVTKGAFFHHFDSKEALGVAAAHHWAETTSGFFATAPYHDPADPLDRLLAYVDFRQAIIAGEICEFTCLAGTTVQETYDVSPSIREACRAAIFNHAATLEPDIEAAFTLHGQPVGVTAKSLALHTQCVLQGAFILAKAANDRGPALDSVDHLRRYIVLLFGRKPQFEYQPGGSP